MAKGITIVMKKRWKELKEKNQIVFTYQEKVNGSLAGIAGDQRS